MNSTIGRRMAHARKEAGITQANLARMLGIAISTLNKYERGHRTPDGRLLAKITETLHCDPAWLLTGEGEGTVTLRKAGRDELELLKEVITTVEDIFAREGTVLKPGKKAELVTLLYEELLDDVGKKTELEAKALKLIRLAA
jgi:transcriptional regulator with XRE-family HTH domain